MLEYLPTNWDYFKLHTGVNVGKYSIHGSSGYRKMGELRFMYPSCTHVFLKIWPTFRGYLGKTSGIKTWVCEIRRCVDMIKSSCKSSEMVRKGRSQSG